jgi:hypothetical protein
LYQPSDPTRTSESGVVYVYRPIPAGL